ncbi:hypothetical protein QBC35DRAFT_383456 [Podospora australis]|uniref:Uncharacterized protein n=1 Tax=Podospora australis TaxID=1536484 RepID=A0AAN6WXP3_9PEZI|nr:hypothetical protein QBC35DRAFT_383456 [Podospora australis]
MLVKTLLPAFVAIGSAAAQSGTCTANGGTTTINSQADATQMASCKTLKGDVVIGTNAGPAIDISGPGEITGALRILNNGLIESFTSNDLTKVGGEFRIQNTTKLSSLNMPKLTSAKTIQWQSVTSLENPTLGPLTSADEIIISDTVLRTLDAFQLKTTRKMDINNNPRLTKFNMGLQNLGEIMALQANGLRDQGIDVDLPNLVWIANMTIANVSTFEVPSLRVVNGSARFDSNFFESFSAPNLTALTSGDLSFIGNAQLTNLTFPKLTNIGGGLLVANNTALEKIDGFPELTHVGGAVKLRGSFDEAELPSLENVKGTFDASSTTDIDSSCKEFEKHAPQGEGGNGDVQGSLTCTSNNTRANEETGTDIVGGGSGGSGDDGENGAVGMSLNSALFGLVALAGFAVAL